MKVDSKVKSLVTSLTAWVGAGVAIVGTYFGWEVAVMAAIEGTTAAVVTIEQLWFKVV